MAKGNMLLGHARGKVGSLVFSRANGQQIVRARAEAVKNPQTEAQLIQRILLNTVAQAYSKMSVIVDHSFEGIPTGQKSMSYFMKRNLEKLRTQLAGNYALDDPTPYVSPISSNKFMPNTYEMAKGTLPVVNPREVTGMGLFSGVSVNTYQGVIEHFGLQRGDQLTIVMVDDMPANKIAFCYARIILDPREEDGSAAALSTPFITDGAITKPNPKNENSGITFQLHSDEILFGVSSVCCAAGLIASRQKEDGTWLRSNSELVVGLDGYTGAINMQGALDDFRSSQLDVVSPQYLNNATNGGSNVSGGSSTQQFQVLAVLESSSDGSVSGAGRYERNQTATLTFTPNEGIAFDGWYSGETLVSAANPYSFVVTQAVTLTAKCHADGPTGD